MDSSSLNYSAGVLVVTFHKATDLQNWLSFRLRTVSYFILGPNLFFCGKTASTVMFCDVLVPASLLKKTWTNVVPVTVPLAGSLLCRWRTVMGKASERPHYLREITLLSSSDTPVTCGCYRVSVQRLRGGAENGTVKIEGFLIYQSIKLSWQWEMFCLLKSLAAPAFKMSSHMQLGCFYVESDTRTILIFVFNGGLWTPV